MINPLQKLVKLTFVFVLSMTFGLASGQIICSNPITAQNPSISNPYTTGQTVADNCTASGIGIGPAISGNAGVDKYTATFWTPSATAVVAGEYFEFIVSPNEGYKINYSNFSFSCQRSSTGPVNGVVRSSLDGFTANIMSFNFAMAVSSQMADLSGTAFQEITIPITFRIYGFGSPSNGATGTASINDYSINGSVLSINPEQIQAPIATLATELTTAGFTANWEAVAGVSAYRLDVSSDENFTNILDDYNNLSVAGLSHYVTLGIVPNTSYYYRVRAQQETLVSVNSNVITVLVPQCNVAAPEASSQSFCDLGTVEQLVPSGTGIRWYSDAIGGEALSNDEVLISGNYYAAQTLNNCESPRTEIVVDIITPELPVGNQMQDFTEGQTLADLDVEGQNLKWYSDEALTNELPETTLLIDGATYYVVTSEGLCNSDSLALQVSLILETIEFESEQIKYYPNPVNEVLIVSYSQEISAVSIYNISGQLVLTAKPNNINAKLDVSSLAAGFYLVDAVSADRHQILKIMKL